MNINVHGLCEEDLSGLDLEQLGVSFLGGAECLGLPNIVETNAEDADNSVNDWLSGDVDIFVGNAPVDFDDDLQDVGFEDEFDFPGDSSIPNLNFEDGEF